jgi:hypothetical protein
MCACMSCHLHVYLTETVLAAKVAVKASGGGESDGGGGEGGGGGGEGGGDGVMVATVMVDGEQRSSRRWRWW